ncbi:hypothetical protein F0145_23880 [Adhaeribacter rhizoryzae]|uniref:Aerotolerance regulator N-terminal domain-containing protein n=1 Tax=Adhaeribacter rhizoryzae TaxID=2607907 RepID=A0A5M6D2E2_9BACT|nr:hypothetical protein F0145_23880 [Adhaeribacter rhizoryzae]
MLLARCLATVLAVASLVLMVLPPQRKISLNASDIILLTPGFSADSLNSLKKLLPPRPIILSYKDAASHYPALATVAALPYLYPSTQRIHLLGFGLDRAELAGLDSVELIPHLSAPPEGFTTVHWPNKLQLGEPLNITGQFYQKKEQETKIYLQSGSSVLDSLVLSAAGTNRFTLRYQPKQVGRSVFSLLRKDAAGKQLAGLVPVQVEPRKLYQVLLLSSSPNFEFKFLKNFLAGQQHGVAWRISISKAIYQTEYLNLPKKPLERLTPNLLRSFDLVITDPDMLQSLNSAERNALFLAVQNGLGLLLIPESLPLKATPALFKNFKFISHPNPSGNTVPLQVSWQNQSKTYPATALPFAISVQANQQKLVWTNKSTLAASQPYNWGKVGVTLIPQTFSWQLAGNTAQYSAFWSHLLGQLIKPEIQDFSWHLLHPLSAVVHQPVSLQLSDYTFSTGAALPEAEVKRVGTNPFELPLLQDQVLSHRFTGQFWPLESGWHQVNKLNGLPSYFYIYPDSVWQTVRQNKLIQLNQEYAQKHSAPLLAGKIRRQEVPISPVWFFCLFLLAAGFLWVEEKL